MYAYLCRRCAAGIRNTSSAARPRMHIRACMYISFVYQRRCAAGMTRTCKKARGPFEEQKKRSARPFREALPHELYTSILCGASEVLQASALLALLSCVRAPPPSPRLSLSSLSLCTTARSSSSLSLLRQFTKPGVSIWPGVSICTFVLVKQVNGEPN